MSNGIGIQRDNWKWTLFLYRLNHRVGIRGQEERHIGESVVQYEGMHERQYRIHFIKGIEQTLLRSIGNPSSRTNLKTQERMRILGKEHICLIPE